RAPDHLHDRDPVDRGGCERGSAPGRESQAASGRGPGPDTRHRCSGTVLPEQESDPQRDARPAGQVDLRCENGRPDHVRQGAQGTRVLGGPRCAGCDRPERSEEHTSELQSRENLVCRLLLEKKKKTEKCNITYM